MRLGTDLALVLGMRPTLFALLLFLGGCSGSLGSVGGPQANGGPHGADGPTTGNPGNPGDPGNPSNPGDPGNPTDSCVSGAISLGDSRLLSRMEMLKTANAAFAPIAFDSSLVAELPDEAVATGFSNNVGAVVSSAFHQQKLIALAESAGDKVAASFASFGIQCADDQKCLEGLFNRSAKRLVRRAVPSAEVQRYVSASLAAATTRAERIRYLVVLLLLSPDFTYELHRAAVADAAVRKEFARFEIAARLGFMIWQQGPDDSMLAEATAGKLDNATGRKDLANRMMTDARFSNQFSRFVREWLQLDLGEWEKDSTLGVDENFKKEALAEIDEMSGRIGAQNGSLTQLFTDTNGFVSPQLKQIYAGDIVSTGAKTPRNLTQVSMNADRRAGLFTRVGFLAANSHSDATSPTILGRTLSQRVFCAEVSDPPADVQNEFPRLVKDDTRTTRQILTDTTKPARCNYCHSVTDPLGLTFSNFDTVGAYRTQEKGLPIDSATDSAVLGPLTDGVDLLRKAATNAQVHACVTGYVFGFSTARTRLDGDQCLVEQLTKAFQADNLNLRPLLSEVAGRFQNP